MGFPYQKRKKYKVDWILIDEIALGSAPKKERHLDLLDEYKIKSILSLCSEEEAEPVANVGERFLCSRVVLPDHRHGRMPEPYEIKNALEELKKLMNNGATFVHCVASMERSPLICIAYLVVEKKYSFQTALDYVMQIHPGTSPLPGQLEALKKLI